MMVADHESARPGGDRRVGGPLAVASVTLGLLTWPIAFNLGAYGEVFYDDIHRVVVASSILLLLTIVNPVYPRPWRWLLWAALAAPLLWLLAAAFLVGSTSEALRRPGFVVGLALIAVISIPLTLRLLVDLFTPELARRENRRRTWMVVALVAVIGIIGFVVGWQHPRFMTCSDFAVAGASEPEGCVR